MGKKSAAFALVDFAHLASSIYLQDGGFSPNSSNSAQDGSNIVTTPQPSSPSSDLPSDSYTLTIPVSATFPYSLIILTIWNGASPPAHQEKKYYFLQHAVFFCYNSCDNHLPDWSPATFDVA